MYDPTLGRFLDRDPIGLLAGDSSLYEYALSNPARSVDPMGLWPFASKTFAILDPYVVREQMEEVNAIIGTLKVSIYGIDQKQCTYKVMIVISSDVPEQKKLGWPRGVNVRTEYFLRQLYQVKGAKLTPEYSKNLVEEEKTTFLQQEWKMPKFENLGDLRKNIVSKDKQGSEAILTAVFKMSDKERGEGWAIISMTGTELGAGGTPPEPLTKTYPMRELNMKWAFDVRTNWASIAFVQPGKPVVK